MYKETSSSKFLLTQKFLNFLAVRSLSLLSCSVLATGCTKIFLGQPEIGSKELPIEVYIDGSHDILLDDTAKVNFQNCVEDASGYRIRIHSAPDEKAIVSALARGSAQFAVLSALSFVGASTKTPMTALFILSRKGLPSTRAVIIGKASAWQEWIHRPGIKGNIYSSPPNHSLEHLNEDTIAYLSPESDVGFFVPRMFFLQNNVFPQTAIFVGSYEAVWQAVEESMAAAGAVSEDFIEKKYPNSIPVQLGTQLSNLLIIGISQNLPGNVVIEGQNVAANTKDAFIKGLAYCASNKNYDFKKIFNADGLQPVEKKTFDFTQELYNFQRENVRVLTQRNE